MAQRVLLTMQEIRVQSLGQEAILEKGMVTHSSILVSPLQKKGAQRNISEKAMSPHSSTLAWKIPWMEEPGRLQTMGSRRVGHD